MKMYGSENFFSPLPVWYENEAWAQYWADEDTSRKADEAWEDFHAARLWLWDYLTEVELCNRGRQTWLKLWHHIDATVNNCYCGYAHSPEKLLDIF